MVSPASPLKTEIVSLIGTSEPRESMNTLPDQSICIASIKGAEHSTSDDVNYGIPGSHSNRVERYDSSRSLPGLLYLALVYMLIMMSTLNSSNVMPSSFSVNSSSI